MLHNPPSFLTRRILPFGKASSSLERDNLPLLAWLTALATLWATFTVTTTVTTSWAGRSTRVVNTEGTVVNRLALELLHGLLSRRDISEISVSESTWLAGAAVNGNTDVNDVLDIAEQLVQVGVGHLEWEVADEEGLGWGVLGTVGLRVDHVVNDHAAAGEEGIVEVLDGLGGGGDILEGNISESNFLSVFLLII